LADFSPSSIPGKNALVVLKCFFDGGNKADSREFDVATLACLCGTEPQWGPFELAWRQVLERNKVRYVHTTDILTGNGTYKGMGEQACQQLLAECVGAPV
jgi:hypothetical protein